jgi:hypothetical protein
VPDEQIVDDTGSEIVFVESGIEGVSRQALWVRVGPVFNDNVPQEEPGVWVNYQPGYLKTGLEGPVLLSPAAWRKLNQAVEDRLQAKGVMPPDPGKSTS